MKGWEKLIRPLLNVLEQQGCEVLQTKEKFGEFRCYWDGKRCTSQDMVAVLRHATDSVRRQSRVTCIECGKTARMHYDGWHLPLCEKHSKERGRDWETASPPTSGWLTNAYEIEEDNATKLSHST